MVEVDVAVLEARALNEANIRPERNEAAKQKKSATTQRRRAAPRAALVRLLLEGMSE